AGLADDDGGALFRGGVGQRRRGGAKCGQQQRQQTQHGGLSRRKVVGPRLAYWPDKRLTNAHRRCMTPPVGSGPDAGPSFHGRRTMRTMTVLTLLAGLALSLAPAPAQEKGKAKAGNTKMAYGKTKAGVEVEQITVTNKSGITLKLISY